MDCDYCLTLKNIVPHVTFHIQNHIEMLAYLTHFDPIWIFKIFNQFGNNKKCLSTNHCSTKSGEYIDAIFYATGPTYEKD